MARYAENTSVSADRTRAEIERTLTRYGATSFQYGWQGEQAAVAFEMRERRIRFLLPLPSKRAREFTHTPAGRPRTSQGALEAWEQATRSRWRALALAIKAKLEAVDAGIVTFEQEFLAHTVLPSGETVGDWMLPQVATAYRTKSMPPMLPGIRDDDASIVLALPG